MTDHLNHTYDPGTDGIICAATLADAAADPALTLDIARELLREAAEAIRCLTPEQPAAMSKVVAWAYPVYARPAFSTKPWEEGDLVDIEFHLRPEKPEGEGWYPLVVADTGNSAAPLPRINVKCETADNGITGAAFLKVIRVEQEDDGSLTAVIDHWPQQVVHPAITFCDNCGCDWLDNGLNPIGCPYCKESPAIGEEIMVNAAHDVYILPLQPSGLLSGPRFVVHVPGPEKPVAVDDLAARLVDELDGLVGESYGVSGLHLNGDVATWDELLPGGRFERLSSLDELRAALDAQHKEPNDVDRR